MFLRRYFLRSTCSHSLPSPCCFSTSTSGPPLPRREYMPNSDCRAIPLRDRVAYLIRLSDLDTAAKHARLAPFAKHDGNRNGLRLRNRNRADDGECAVDWVCGAVIVAMCKARRYRDALDLIRYFFKEHKMVPPQGSFCHLLKGVLDDSSNAALTLHWVKRLAQAGCFENASAMAPFAMRLEVSHILIRGLLDRGDLEEARKLFAEIKLSADMNSSIRYGTGHNRLALAGATFMEYWFKQGKEEEAMEWYSNLSATELQDIQTPGAIALVEVLLKYDKKTQAWALFHALSDSSSDTPHYHHVDKSKLNTIMVNECFKMGRLHTAILTFKTPFSHPYPEASGYGNIITRFCELGWLSEAEYFLEEMRMNRINADLSTYKALMDAYVKAGRVDDVHRISNHMVDAFLNQVAKHSRLSFPVYYRSLLF
ncbi:unnamed protein product [Microthlaspi erraticum]|uniref:Pentacotripeptide-repeat region of PRORP domain-containing protein n=1 Tax=Microthlaspi erraticum TaxID=1685480 RepID=A0A6D2K7X6_9BRAS|nr:unnamed protein product [Microthlaspi erraticum]CAA7052969.1 unnamed protein product [Microthlaspi erraticum]